MNVEHKTIQHGTGLALRRGIPNPDYFLPVGQPRLAKAFIAKAYVPAPVSFVIVSVSDRRLILLASDHEGIPAGLSLSQKHELGVVDGGWVLGHTKHMHQPLWLHPLAFAAKTALEAPEIKAEGEVHKFLLTVFSIAGAFIAYMFLLRCACGFVAKS